MTPPDIAAIARGLSEAQREIMVGRYGRADHTFYPGRQHRACHALAERGLLEPTTDSVGNTLFRRTPLGLALRDHLLSGKKAS